MRPVFASPFLVRLRDRGAWPSLSHISHFFLTSRIFISHLAFLSRIFISHLAFFISHLAFLSRIFISHLAFLSRISHFYLASRIFYLAFTSRNFFSFFIKSHLECPLQASVPFLIISHFLLNVSKVLFFVHTYFSVKIWLP